MEEKRHYTIGEAAKEIGISTRTFRDRILRRGLLTFYRVAPKCVVIKREHLEEYLESCCCKRKEGK
jgi:excisionase family DNA binding protein